MKLGPAWIVVSVLVVALLFVACSRASGSEITWASTKELVRSTFPQAPQMSVDELASLLQQEDATPPLLLDVREADEYAVSHLPGAVHAQGEDIVRLSEAAAPGQQIIVYCSVGYRSSREVEKLLERGVENAVNLDGSIFEWANAGHEVVRGEEPVRAVHPFDDEWGQLLDQQLRRYEP